MPDGEWGKNWVSFGVENNSSRPTSNRKNDILILGDSITDELEDATITAEAKHFVNIARSRKKLFRSTLQCDQQVSICQRCKSLSNQSKEI